YAMFDQLHDTSGYGDYREAVLRKALSPAALAFFNSPDISWSAALDGSEIPPPPLPSPEQFKVGPTNAQASISGRTSSGLGEVETDADSSKTPEPGVLG